MTADSDGLSAAEIALAVAGRKLSALRVTEAALARIAKHDPVLNSFTDVTADRARAKARAVDAAVTAGQNAGPLAGVPFAVKNLFDVQGLPTRAGSKINRDLKPSPRDATLIERMEAAGAVLVGALNMGEYAYDFTGENVHDGPSRNPHDVTRMTGGSSGGSGGAVGGGLVPLALGSDTNGSIRVPSSLCGIFGLKPTYGRLSRARSFPFVFSLDHLGPFARHVGDLALAYDAMQGPDPDDAACTTRPAEPVTPMLAQEIGDLRVAIAGGYFQNNVFPEASEAVARIARALGTTRTVEIPEAARARAAAYVITATEGASLHLDRLRKRPDDFDPAVRDRLLAGAMIPAALVDRAQKFRRWYRARCWSCSNRSMWLSRRQPLASRRNWGRRHSCSTASNWRCAPIWVSTPSRFPSSGFRWSRCPFRCSRCRSACRSLPHPGAKISRCAWLSRWSAAA